MYVPHIHSVGMKVCGYLHVYIYVGMCTYMQKSKTDIRSQLLCTLCPETGSSLSLGFGVLTSLTSQLALGISCLYLMYLEYRQTTMSMQLLQEL